MARPTVCVLDSGRSSNYKLVILIRKSIKYFVILGPIIGFNKWDIVHYPRHITGLKKDRTLAVQFKVVLHGFCIDNLPVSGDTHKKKGVMKCKTCVERCHRKNEWWSARGASPPLVSFFTSLGYHPHHFKTKISPTPPPLYHRSSSTNTNTNPLWAGMNLLVLKISWLITNRYWFLVRNGMYLPVNRWLDNELKVQMNC